MSAPHERYIIGASHTRMHHRHSPVQHQMHVHMDTREFSFFGIHERQLRGKHATEPD